MRSVLRRNKQAVSPVVATLMLVLVAVGTSAGLYLWLSGWQNSVQDDIGAPAPQASITIGGSSTVFEFTKAAVPLFELSQPGIKVDFQSGGSGAGVLSICHGVVDIGSASRYVKSSEFAVCPDLDNDGVKDVGQPDLREITLAFDAVVPVTNTANAHGLQRMDRIALQEIYCINSGSPTFTTPGDYSTLSFPAGSGCTSKIASWYQMDDSTGGGWGGDGNGKIDWDELPNTLCAAAGSFPIATPAIGTCTGAGVAIVTYDRLDAGGTSEVATQQLFGFSGSQLESVGINANQQGEGNQGVQAKLATDAHGLGFTSFGGANNDASMKTYSFSITTTAAGPTAISAFVTASPATIKNASFAGSRPIQYVTIGEPTGDIARYIDFVLGPDINQQICIIADFVSIYA
jgi:phosphate transport system substrate-binding protein